MAYPQQTIGSNPRIVGSCHGVPCRYELELCKFRDVHPRVEHVPASTFPDSECEEDMMSLQWQRNVALKDSPQQPWHGMFGLPYHAAPESEGGLYTGQQQQWTACTPANHPFSQPSRHYPPQQDICSSMPEVGDSQNPAHLGYCPSDDLNYPYHSQMLARPSSATQFHISNPGPSHPPLVGYQDVSYNRPLTGRGRGGLNLAPGSGRDGYGPQGTWQERTQGGLSAQGTGQAAQYTGRFLAGKGTCSKWSVPDSGQSSSSYRNWKRETSQAPSRQRHLQGSSDQQRDGPGGRPVLQVKAYDSRHMQHVLEKPGITSVVPRNVLEQMPLSQKLFHFIQFICSEQPRINDIQTIENAITGCHLNLKTQYETEDVGTYQGRRVFSGKLSISSVFLARAVGHTKKELKHECYKLALQVLKTKSVQDIMDQKDIGIEVIRDKFEECSGHKEPGKPADDIVSLASVVPISIAFETIASREERWANLLTTVTTTNLQAANSICRIEMALSGSHCGLARVYSSSNMIRLPCNKYVYQGSLSIGGVLQAQACGSKKKEAKLKTYDAALERFLTLELPDILKGVEPQDLEDTKVEEKVRHVSVKEIRTTEQIKKLETFIDRVKDSSVREGPITLLDLTSNQMQLLLTLVYKRDSVRTGDGPIHLCQLYIGDILIAEGEGKHKRMAQVDVYNRAYEVLISTPVETIISENHRLEPGELEDPDVLDVVVKGHIRREESNLTRLREQHQNIEEVLSLEKSEALVIVENQDWTDDRKRHAFCILQNSCMLNIMLLRWCMDVETGFFSCKVSIQGEEMGAARAGTKQQARNLAAADALFKMYETNPVIRVTAFDDSQIWILYERLLEMAKTLPESELPSAEVKEDEDLKSVPPQTPNCVGEAEHAVALDEGNSNAKVDNVEDDMTEVQLGIVVGKLVKEFVDKQDFTQELVFEPKVPCCVRRAVATHAAQSGLHMAQRQKEGRLYLALSFKVPMTKVVEAMKSRGLVSAGRYMLVEDRSDLPTHSDIVTDLELASKTTKQDWLASRQALKQLDRSSKETGVGISLNGSLFEETLDGFVTAQSLLAESMVSAHPLIQSTPNRKMETEFTDLHPSIVPRAESFPTLCATATAKPEQPTSDMYSKFAAAMVASGIAQTFIPLETVDNILINPPTSSSLGNKTPMIKNILVSPPSSDVRCVMISAPAEDLSPQAIPQPDFSLSSTPTPPSFRSSKDIQGKSPIMKKWESQTSEKCKHSIFASCSNGSAIRTYRTRFEAEESVTTQAESSFLLQGVGAQRLHTKRQNNESDSSIKRGCYGDRNRQFKPQTADHELQKWDERWRWCAQNQAGMPEDCVIQMSPASFIDQGKGWGGFPFESTCMYVENEMVGAHCRRRGPLHNPV
ncbi:uncharacterized protein LOC112576257 isoform X3 [Pomacea canaliculata]|uniref:uncharacterized protein LOC112576257 isoform X3 n=1 Tax=Pomacea canaliculata TaxID=400727 RepID=UPI000D72678C|nr:uncharacterized protein LOC112576257 isoform X3 [Pomacea canaliculata]